MCDSLNLRIHVDYPTNQFENNRYRFIQCKVYGSLSFTQFLKKSNLSITQKIYQQYTEPAGISVPYLAIRLERGIQSLGRAEGLSNFPGNQCDKE